MHEEQTSANEDPIACLSVCLPLCLSVTWATVLSSYQFARWRHDAAIARWLANCHLFSQASPICCQQLTQRDDCMKLWREVTFCFNAIILESRRYPAAATEAQEDKRHWIHRALSSADAHCILMKLAVVAYARSFSLLLRELRVGSAAVRLSVGRINYLNAADVYDIGGLSVTILSIYLRTLIY